MTHFPKHLKDPRTCRVFVSSPFGGFEKEREELTLKHFPKLSHMCQQKGIQFVTVDMRWGITAEAATDAQIVNICLREVDRSDIFVGMYGQRYGWHGAKDAMFQKNIENAIHRYSWLSKFKDRSVTEMEFLHGHLNRPGHTPSIVIFRDKKYDDGMKTAALQDRNKPEADKYTSESNDVQNKLADLKSRVAKSKCLAFKDTYPTPQEGTQFVFEELQTHVMKLIAGGKQSLSKRDMDLSLHNAYMASRMLVNVGGENYDKVLDSAVRQGGQKLLVVGPPGSGKAALLSHWINKCKKAKNPANFVYHFIGSSAGSAVIANIMRRLTLELNHAMGDVKKTKKESLEEMDENMAKSSAEMSDLYRELELTLSKASVKHKVVVVIDGLGKLEALSKTAKPLFWIPLEIPKNVTLIVTCRDHDKDALDEIKFRDYTVIQVKPLNRVEREAMCKELLKTHSKELSTAQLQKVMSVKQTENPFYLTIVISELCAFGQFLELDKKIDQLISCKSVNELFQVFLRRLETDYIEVESHGNLIEQVMSSIWVSHNGLSEKEIMAMHNIPSHEWSPLYFAINNYLLEMNGLIKFGFKELRNAVEERYLKDKNSRLKYQKIVANYFEEQRKLAGELIHLDDASLIRPADELPRIYNKMGDHKKLIAVLSDLSIFSRFFLDQEFELIELWRATGLSGDQIAGFYLKAVEEKALRIAKKATDDKKDISKLISLTLISYLGALSIFCELAMYKSAEERVLSAQLKLMEMPGADLPTDLIERNMNNIKMKLANLYTDTGRYEESEKLHKEVLDIRLKQLKEANSKAMEELSLKGVGNSYHGVAMLYSKLGKEDLAIEYYMKAMEVQKQLNNEADVADALHNMGVMYMKRGNFKHALDMCTKSLKIYEDLYFANLPPVIGVMIGNIAVCHRNLGQVDEAEKMYKRGIEINERAVGRQHPNVAFSLMNLGVLEINRKEFIKAEVYLRECVEIYQKTETAETNLEYYRGLEKFVYVLLVNKKMDEGNKYFKTMYSMAKHQKLMKVCWPDVYVRMCTALVASKSYPLALGILETLQECPNYPDQAMVLYKDVCKALGKGPQIDVSLEAIYKKNPGNLRFLQKYVMEELIPADDASKIIQALETTNKTRSLGPDLFGTAIMWCEEKGKQDLSFTLLEHTAGKFPKEVNFVAGFANRLYDAQQFDRVIPLTSTLCELEPTNVNHWLMRGDAAIRTEDFTTAKGTYNEMVVRFSKEGKVVDQVNLTSPF